MLGKLFSSEFGKGLIAGTAKGFEKGFADDIERTKNNVDNLVLESYKGAVESKKEFDRVYKDNRKIVDQIIANLGGEQGADNPDAIYAAQGLIADQSLNGALEYSAKLAQLHNDNGLSPIKMLKMAKNTDHKQPITADLLTKSTVPPISVPSLKELAKGANVGIMKFFGDEDYTANEVESRASQLIRARGINIEKGDLNLPPAAQVKIDPVILGMKENLFAEKLRLHKLLENTDENDTERLATIKNLLDSTNAIIAREKLEKAKRIPGPLTREEEEPIENLIDKLMISRFGLKSTANFRGGYEHANVKKDKRLLLMKYKRKALDMLREATEKGLYKNIGFINFNKEISEAVGGNKNLIFSNGILTTGEQDFYTPKDHALLMGSGEEGDALGKVDISKEVRKDMTISQQINLLKKAQKNSPYKNSMKQYIDKSSGANETLYDMANQLMKENPSEYQNLSKAIRYLREQLGITE